MQFAVADMQATSIAVNGVGAIRWTAHAARRAARDGRGFSLLEVLVATTLVVVAVAALAQLCTISTRANHDAKATTFASLLAAQKMEQLRGLAYGFDPIGLPVTDTTTDITVSPEANGGGFGLSPSPAGTLGANTTGYCDYLDAAGTSLGGGATPPAGTVYIRRWSVEPLPANPNNTLVLQVLVTPWRNRGSADGAPRVRRLPDEARIVSAKTRKAT